MNFDEPYNNGTKVPLRTLNEGDRFLHKPKLPLGSDPQEWVFVVLSNDKYAFIHRPDEPDTLWRMSADALVVPVSKEA